VVGRTGENFGVEKRWKKKKSGQGGWDYRSSGKRPQRAHPQLVHWWLLIHSSRRTPPTFKYVPTTIMLLIEVGTVVQPK
jgi:hypothetical protein